MSCPRTVSYTHLDEVQSVLAFIAAFEAYDGSRLGIACADERSGALSIAGTLIRTQDGQLIHHMNARGPVTIPPESVYETLCTLSLIHISLSASAS